MQTCDDTAEKISLLIDGMLGKEETQELAEHIKFCEACRDSYDEMTYLIQTLHDIPQPELPPGLHESLMDTICMVKEKDEKPKRRALPDRLNDIWRSRSSRGLNFKVFAAAAAGVIGTLLLLSVLSAGLSSINHPSPSSVADISYGFASTSNGAASADLAQLETAQFGEEAGSDYFTAEASIENNLISQDFPTGKSILNTANGNSAFRYTFRIDLTVSDLSNAVSILQGMNGYTMNSEINQTSGYASITRRIDLSAYENAKTVLRNIGEIDHEEESSELLSGQQLELNAQLTAKRQEQARLLQLLGKSASIDVLTKVESQLSGVENTADRLQGQLNAIIDEANQPYLVVYIHTKSVVSVSGALSFGSRISNSFKRSYNGVQSFLEGALIFSVGAAMPLLLLVLFVVIVLLLFRRILKRGGKA